MKSLIEPMKDTKTKIEDIALDNFAKSISTEEFIAVLELMKAMYDNFEKAIVRKDESIVNAFTKLQTMEKELSAYDPQVRNLRREYNLMDEALTEDIAGGFKLFIRNYDGAIEFLTRFSICNSIKKRDINKYKPKKKKDGKK